MNQKMITFDKWWGEVGFSLDPDPDVPCFDKRKEFARYAWNAARTGLHYKDGDSDFYKCDVCDEVVHISEMLRPGGRTDDLVCSEACAESWNERYCD